VELAGLKRIFVVPHPHLHHDDDDGGGENNNSSSKKNKKRRSKKKNNNTVVLLGGGARGKHKLMMMHNNIWQTMIFPVKRLCLALSTTINHRKNGTVLVNSFILQSSMIHAYILLLHDSSHLSTILYMLITFIQITLFNPNTISITSCSF
jgi:hypothetical protein